MTHKILARAAGVRAVSTGSFVEVEVDMCFAHDPVLVQLRDLFYREFGADARVWDPEKIVLIQDHLVPAKDSLSRHFAAAMDRFVEEQAISRYYPYGPKYGVCHIVMCEEGHVLPGQVVLGTDSHSVTYGAFNAFGSGVGLIDMLNVFSAGRLWFRVPEVIEVAIDGVLPPNVQAKDVILRLLGDIGMAGASSKTIEFTGSTVAEMSAEERMTLCNMSVEAGATNGIMALTSAARAYLARARPDAALEPVETDPGFEYARRLSYRAEELTPMVACPHRPDNVRSISELKGQRIAVEQVYVGSCTGAKLEDIAVVARTLAGERVADGVQLMIVPATMRIYREMLAQGHLASLMASGAVIESPGCKACYGAHGGVSGDGEVCLSTTNRNFRGRMGNPKASVYLASPYVAARSAIAGFITD
ncbi:MAG: aconitase/3-isopropylmalate dehydratase large subunit family protein [Nannocystaceae bacterium]